MRLDTFTASARLLVEASLGTDAYERLRDEQETRIADLSGRFTRLSTRLNDAIDTSRAELTQSAGLRRQLALEFTQLARTLTRFLDETERTLASFGTAIPTDTERLEAQQRLQADTQARADSMRTQFDRLGALNEELAAM